MVLQQPALLPRARQGGSSLCLCLRWFGNGDQKATRCLPLSNSARCTARSPAPHPARDSPAVLTLSPVLEPRTSIQLAVGTEVLARHVPKPTHLLAPSPGPRPHLSLASRARGGVSGRDRGCVLLQQLEAQAGQFLLDAHHDGRVILVAAQLLAEVTHALLDYLVLPAQVHLDALRGQDSRVFLAPSNSHHRPPPPWRGHPSFWHHAWRPSLLSRAQGDRGRVVAPVATCC